MDSEIVGPVYASELAAALGRELVGDDILIGRIRALSSLEDAALSFSNVALLKPAQRAAIIFCGEADNRGKASIIVTPVPRLDFARALAWLDAKSMLPRSKEPAWIHPTALIGKGVVLGHGVRIGARTIISHNAVIGDGVEIGEDCIIKSCAVIGEDGFGFERDESGLPLRLIHIGSVVIGNHVEIGSLTTVCRGTLGNTIIEDHVKVDDHVHIAHNVRLRKACMVVACAEVSGGVDVGEYSWIGPNASIIQKVVIGERALVGIGANVLKPVAAQSIVAGNPAKPLLKTK